MKQHRVVYDTAGFNPRQRLTCMEPECKGATLVRHPWMDNKVWDEKLANFKANHPHDKEEWID